MLEPAWLFQDPIYAFLLGKRFHWEKVNRIIKLWVMMPNPPRRDYLEKLSHQGTTTTVCSQIWQFISNLNHLAQAGVCWEFSWLDLLNTYSIANETTNSGCDISVKLYYVASYTFQIFQSEMSRGTSIWQGSYTHNLGEPIKPRSRKTAAMLPPFTASVFGHVNSF